MSPETIESSDTLERGALRFSIESRIIRELGERLVRQPDVAILELIKNSYDADADRCEIELVKADDASGLDERLIVRDDGTGMTISAFRDGWMRLGTGGKGRSAQSAKYGRQITGEKGIGRLAVRFLGGRLDIESVADDPRIGSRTSLKARFRWSRFDARQDLGDVRVPYVLTRVDDGTPTGTTLTVTELRPAVHKIDWKALRTGSMGVVSPVRALLRGRPVPGTVSSEDPGFELTFAHQEVEDSLSARLLARYTLRAELEVDDGRLTIEVFEPGKATPRARITETVGDDLGYVRADIRFFPRRTGAFAELGADGRRAYTWVRENSGVLLFDRGFRMRPYGYPGDDWLGIIADAARNLRDPKSTIMRKHFPMTPEVKASTKLNWMLRLPEAAQLLGVVEVSGKRGGEVGEVGLIAAADREGFLDNPTYERLVDVVRGAVELIAYVDREVSLEDERRRSEQNLRSLREETSAAVAFLEDDKVLPMEQRTRIIDVLRETQARAERQDEGAKEREQQLEVLSLLGVVAGFMTHEFGAALFELEAARDIVWRLAEREPSLVAHATAIGGQIDALNSFVRYSRAYIEGAKIRPATHYPAKARLNHVRRTFERYAEQRGIVVGVEVEAGVMAPLVPAALYDGIAQNLYTNALKAVSGVAADGDRRIVFRAWNEGRWHRLQVSDTGVGIPLPVRKHVFDPLFTTTDGADDPLGSGMGLGLALVRRSAAAFGGTAEVSEPPPGFVTCVEVRLPYDGED